jgi:mannose-6-phosphate isomerase class I
MSYLKRLGLGEASYDKSPCVAVNGYEASCFEGWEAVIMALRDSLQPPGSGRLVVAIECYSGVLDDELVPAIREGLCPELWIHSAEGFKDAKAIDSMVAPELGGDDPIFGRLTRLRMIDFIDTGKQQQIQSRIENAPTGLTIVYGSGATLLCNPDVVIYADMARWEEQIRQRQNLVSNLGVSNKELKASLKYKRSYFIDWRVCDKLKRATMDSWDFYLDTCEQDNPKLLTAAAWRAGLAATVRRPFRVVPFFDPGVWGGQWMREVCGLPESPPNYAWCFDCVPEENSLKLQYGQTIVETPAINLVFGHPVELLGEPVYGAFGAEFPIRFDFLDTMGGQNLSFQVHPLIDYAYEHFGLRYTQDESYYILDAEPEATVYLGLKETADPADMLADLERATKDPNAPFDDEKHVARFPARKHDHFLIPAGTCHCSGANTMVLEISHTPYIFTFKLWDWARLDLNGLPRPINLERGKENILWNRRENWVREHLVNAVEPVASGAGWREEKTGLYRSEAFETRRHWFTGLVEHDTHGDSVHVLNLVQGEEILVESPDGAFAPYLIHFAETFIVPAAVGRYTIRPYGPSVNTECATMKAYLRVKG